MLFYQKYQPAPILQPYVECFFIWEWNVGTAVRLVESPPNGFASLVINYGDSYRVGDLKLGERETPQAFLSGQFTQRYHLQLTGQIGAVGIVFKPTGMAAFSRVPMYELTGERLCFESVFGKEGKGLIEKIGNSTSSQNKVDLLGAFLVRQLLHENSREPSLDFAANRIVACNGIVKMDELFRGACMSRRNFERKFFERVGVSPKYYTRLRRISHICYQLGATEKIDWQRLIGSGDYYDQAHFIKDFKDFMGEAPSVYAQNRAELSHHMNRR